MEETCRPEDVTSQARESFWCVSLTRCLRRPPCWACHGSSAELGASVLHWTPRTVPRSSLPSSSHGDLGPPPRPPAPPPTPLGPRLGCGPRLSSAGSHPCGVRATWGQFEVRGWGHSSRAKAGASRFVFPPRNRVFGPDSALIRTRLLFICNVRPGHSENRVTQWTCEAMTDVGVSSGW